MNGIRSVSRSFSNAANAGDCLGIGSRAVTSFAARPFGRTTIIGTAFLSAYELSRITLGDTAARPFVLVAADAVEEVQDRILLVLGVSRRRIDLSLALDPDGRRVVLDRLELAVVDAVTANIETIRRRGETAVSRLGVAGNVANASTAQATSALMRLLMFHPLESEWKLIRRPGADSAPGSSGDSREKSDQASASSDRSASNI